MNHIKLSFPVTDQDRRETLMALLSALDFTGFEETDALLIAYADEAHYDQPAVEEIAENLQLSFDAEQVAQRNWNEEWEKNFQPVIIDGFCSVRADFHPRPEHVAYDIVITPKMSFGTGHHATTALMMTFMRELDMKGKEVFDFGTGTGILAILAEMLGAESVLAIDNDEWSFENAQENCTRNHATRVDVRLADTLPASATFDIILANINRHILLAYMDRMAALLRPGGILLLSGILPEDTAVIAEAAKAQGFTYQKEQADRNWACMQYCKA
ncbi:50S ribosomal protein L11 methyltransferase [Taibaiella helva]|uniref:50S ribosomal protein L11 methyltransferase n=1 Tax=Taibaiella helva TaxID=2301235 RepID=UPI000E572686|nr:50S ribosomal protein L11 methyltransferase [Taibaiella helva]